MRRQSTDINLNSSGRSHTTLLLILISLPLGVSYYKECQFSLTLFILKPQLCASEIPSDLSSDTKYYLWSDLKINLPIHIFHKQPSSFFCLFCLLISIDYSSLSNSLFFLLALNSTKPTEFVLTKSVQNYMAHLFIFIPSA